jgi:hypothetical protein
MINPEEFVGAILVIARLKCCYYGQGDHKDSPYDLNIIGDIVTQIGGKYQKGLAQLKRIKTTPARMVQPAKRRMRPQASPRKRVPMRTPMRMLTCRVGTA